MDEREQKLQEFRRMRMRAEIAGPRFRGNQADFARAAGKPARQINDMLSDPPRKNFADKVARDIALSLKYAPDYFEPSFLGSPPPAVVKKVGDLIILEPGDDKHIKAVLRIMRKTDVEGRIKCVEAVRWALKNHIPAKKGMLGSSE